MLIYEKSKVPYCEECRLITLPDTIHYCEDCIKPLVRVANAAAKFMGDSALPVIKTTKGHMLVGTIDTEEIYNALKEVEHLLD